MANLCSLLAIGVMVGCWAASPSWAVPPVSVRRSGRVENPTAQSFRGLRANSDSRIGKFVEPLASKSETHGVGRFLITGSMIAALAATTSVAPATDTQNTGLRGIFGKSTVWVYISLWYVFSVAYNIYFKKALEIFPFPWTCALFQMVLGCGLFTPLWAMGIRQAPSLTIRQIITLLPAAVGNLLLHVGAVVAFCGGAVSFVHIVKASEPVVSAFVNLLFIGEVLPLPAYAALIPIVGGVILASMKEMTFNWFSFGSAMLSNLGAAGRGVYTKRVLGSSNIGKNMGGANTFSVMTLMGAVLLFPLCLYMEPVSAVLSGFKLAFAMGGHEFVFNMIASGFCFYVYNELAFLALGELDAVSHAVVNTIKRVVIISVAIFVFRTPISLIGAVGSAIAIVGTLLYSLAKGRDGKPIRT